MSLLPGIVLFLASVVHFGAMASPRSQPEVSLADVTDMPPDSPHHAEAVAHMTRSAPGVASPPSQDGLAVPSPEPAPEPTPDLHGHADHNHGHPETSRRLASASGGVTSEGTSRGDVSSRAGSRPASSRLDVLHNPSDFLAENQRRLEAGLPTLNFTGLTIDEIEKMLFGRFRSTSPPASQPSNSTADPDLAILARALASRGSPQPSGPAPAQPGIGSSRGDPPGTGRGAASSRSDVGIGGGGSGPSIDLSVLAQALASLSNAGTGGPSQASSSLGHGLSQGAATSHSGHTHQSDSTPGHSLTPHNAPLSSPLGGSGGVNFPPSARPGHPETPSSSNALTDAILGALQRLGVSPARLGQRPPPPSHSQSPGGSPSSGSPGHTAWADAFRGVASLSTAPRSDAVATSAANGASPLLGRSLGVAPAHARGLAESQVAREMVRGPPADSGSGTHRLVADLRREFAEERRRDEQLLDLVNSLNRQLSASGGLPRVAPPAPPVPGHAHSSSGGHSDAFLRHLHQDLEDLRTRVAQLEGDLRKANEDRSAHSLALERLSAHVQRNELSVKHVNESQHDLHDEVDRARDTRVNMWRRIAELQRNLTLAEMSMKHNEVDFSLSLLVLGGNLTALEANVTSLNSSLLHQMSDVTDKLQALQLCTSQTASLLRNLSASNRDQTRQLSKLADQRCEMGDKRIVQYPFDARQWPLKRQVRFSKQFARAPFVHVGIGGLQAERGFNLAIICSANVVSASGFEILCETNTNVSRVYGVNVTWLACLL